MAPRDALYRHGAPGAVLYVSWLWEAVSLASGERHHRIVDPAADVAMAAPTHCVETCSSLFTTV